MDLNQITLFARVVDAGSFTAAARDLGLPKSSVSRGVAALEEALGVQLLQRTTRKLHLTDAGREYFAGVRVALSSLNDAANAVSELGEDPRGTVRMTAPVDLGLSVMAGLLERFTTRYPRIHVDLSLTSRHVDLVAEGFDLALRAAPHLKDSSLKVTRVGFADFGLFASRRYLQRRAAPRCARELAQHCCVLFNEPNGKASWTLEGPQGLERIEVSGPISCDELAFVPHAIKSGFGIGQLPTVALDRKSDPELVRLLPQYKRPGAWLYVVLPAARHRPLRVTLLRDHLIGACKQLAWGR